MRRPVTLLEAHAALVLACLIAVAAAPALFAHWLVGIVGALVIAGLALMMRGATWAACDEPARYFHCLLATGAWAAFVVGLFRALDAVGPAPELAPLAAASTFVIPVPVVAFVLRVPAGQAVLISMLSGAWAVGGLIAVAPFGLVLFAAFAR